MPPIAHPTRRGAAAYTLLEVLLAIGIFVIGFVALASLFPAAAMLQKATVTDVNEQEFARSMKAMIGAVATDAKLLSIGAAKNGNVYDITNPPTNTILGANDLAFPQFSTNKQLYAKTYTRWNGTAWVFYNFLLRPDSAGSAPAVSSFTVSVSIVGTQTAFQATGGPPWPDVAPGDAFLDDQGSTYYVSEYDSTTHVILIDGFTSATPTKIWAAPANKCKRIAVNQ